MRPDTHVVEVEGVGSFEVRRPIMRTAIRIEVEYSRLTEGLETVPDELSFLCRIMAYLKVMIVSGPDDWDVDNCDPYTETEVTRLREVYDALNAAEARFRSKSDPKPQAEGEGPQSGD
jgi:hypothetical protein